MARLLWIFPDSFSLIWCLAFASVVYVVIRRREGAKTLELARVLLIFAGLFVVASAFPILVFPVLLLLLPTFLLAKLGSKAEGVKLLVILGLLPFVWVFGRAKYEESRSGPYYRLDKFKMPTHFAKTLGNHPAPWLTEEQLLEALVRGDATRSHNASALLQARVLQTEDPGRLHSLLQSVQSAMAGRPENEDARELLSLIERELERAKSSGSTR
jgi:hypothetical protein